jgi:hypothetical protein
MPRHQRRIHVRDETFPSRALCGRDWRPDVRGGRIASSTSPPVVVNDETGSANALTCAVCWARWRAKNGLPRP